MASAGIGMLIGVKCRDAIVVASDSRTTYGATQTVSDNRVKVRTFCRDRLVIGCCDDGEAADRLFDVLEQLTTVPDALALHTLVMQARLTVAAQPHRSWPRLQVIAGLSGGDSRRLVRLFSASGYDPTEETLCWVGPNVDASFLLSRYWRPTMPVAAAVCLLVATVAETAALSSAVGGTVTVGVLDDAGARLLPEAEVAGMLHDWSVATGGLRHFFS